MLIFALKHSKRLKLWLIIIHLLGLCACFANGLPMVVQALLAIALLGHYRWLLQQKRVWQTLRHSEALGWEMAGPGGFVAVRIVPDTVMTTFALFLHVEITASRTYIDGSRVFDGGKGKNRQSILLLPDSLDADGYRRFVVKLKTTYKIKSKSANLLIESV